MLEDGVEAFVQSLAHLEEITRKGYRSMLRVNARMWQEQGCIDVGQLSESQLLEWVNRRKRQVVWRGICMELRLVKRFLDSMVKRGALLSNPLPQWLLECYKPTYRGTLVPEERETRIFVDGAADAGVCCRLRDRAIVEVLYGCGLRSCEVVALNLKDWREDELRVRGKFGSERIVPVGRVAAEAIRDYVDKERPRVLGRFNLFEPALFAGVRGGRLRSSSIGAMFRRRLGRTIRPHQLRHACATHMLRNGASIVVLKDMLGHRGINTTRIYTEVKVEDVRSALGRYHPRG